MNAQIEELGGTLVAISPELQVESRKIHRGKKLPFDILFDEDNRVADLFGLSHEVSEEIKTLYLSFGIDLQKSQGNSRWRLPMPARYVVAGNGVVKSMECDPDYTHRPEPADTVSVLREMIQGCPAR